MSTFAIFVALLCVMSTGATVKELAELNTDFGFSIYKQLTADPDVKDIFFSPISISTALAMLQLGTNGTTEDQINRAMKFDTLSQNENVAVLFHDLNAKLYNASNNYTLKSANRFFGSKRFPFRQTFLSDMRDYFNAEPESVDFTANPEGSRVHINKWVERQTADKIKNLLAKGTITKSTVFVLANAIYFKGLWNASFNSSLTKELPFKTNDQETNIPMMKMLGEKYRHGISATWNCQILELPYTGNVSMFVFLPNEPDGLPQLESAINSLELNSLVKNLTKRPVDVYLPRFELKDVTIKLADHLKKLGMTDMFVDGEADLSGIGGAPGQLFISTAVHQAYVKVDEEGTEAGAATASGGAAGMRPQEFKADHPFMFMIRDNITETILFMGRLHEAPGKSDTTLRFN
ncbi:leukocyte elastase inhibitor [Lingula anatina]|uniref:Leukocyte elastase inhibitor n=1 Tax=Lingula anatina TaxID=7574 RepID=A0A1S3I064_LINAN|nr:leukocyte elastase inhibitor [Lingula anatina]|eukprot:XP_013390739.1 leukocyte elastase inhibitor [Lingula anatina]